MRITLILLVLFYTHLNAQNLVWANSLAGKGTSTINNLSPGTSICKDIAIDQQNNVYIVGYLNDTVDVDPGPAIHYLDGGNDDVFLAKYSQSGDLLWAHVISSVGWNYTSNIEIDEENNIVISGNGSSSADFDPGSGVALVSVAPGNANFFFIAKYTSAGDFVWVKSVGGAFGVTSFDLKVDRSNNICVTGTFYNSVDFDPDAGVAEITSSGMGVFFAKYSATGGLRWAKHLSGVGQYGGGSSLACSDDGDIFIAGFFGANVDFDPGPSTHVITATISAQRFFAKYDDTGNFIWAKSINTNENGGFVVGRSIQLAVDAQENLYVSGNYSGTVDFDPNATQLIYTAPQGISSYLCKYDLGGNLIWAKSIDASLCFSTSLVVDCNQAIYLAGSFASADFDPSPANAILTSNAPSAFMNFFAKYDENGNYSWAKMIGNNGYGGGTLPAVIMVKDNNQYVAGAFKQSGDFDPSLGNSILAASGVGHNTFFAKYESNASSDSPSFSLGADTVICKGAALILQAPNSASNYSWNDGTITSYYTVVDSGSYWVETSIHNCTFSDTIYVGIEVCETQLEMPNIFSPNGDGVNDNFEPIKMKNIREAELIIYNRWGQKIFETSQLNGGWNGKLNDNLCNEGTYYWILKYTTLTNEHGDLRGFLSLIR